MLGAGLGFNRSRNGDDRFYSAARGRKNQDYLRRAQSDVTPRTRLDEPESEPDKAKQAASASPALMSEPSPLCNLERFLESVTPSVPQQYLSKMAMRSWSTCNAEFQPFFVLSDLWESFKEWSAYGAGVPLILNGSDSVVQYYVPYLSGIQLYADRSKSTANLRRPGEESDSEYFRDSGSDGSSDSDQDRGGLNYSREQHNMTFQEGFSSDEGESGTSQGTSLLFEYLARDPPFCREPLADKICHLAREFPDLKMFRSCDLLPSSWISVAWYPIYRIPTGPTLKDLDACFLTFHFLHTPITGYLNKYVVPGNEATNPSLMKYETDSDGVPKISLPVFGLASYKFKSSLWTADAAKPRQLTNSLLQAANNWLNLLDVNHPDFSFFTRR